MKHRFTRELIHIIARNAYWSEAGVDRALVRNVYAGKRAWSKFFDLFLLALGVGFAVSGIIFFFAYNWDDMHKFAKMGIVGALLIGCIVFVLRAPTSATVKNIVLAGAALLVGGLFAVFGQTYQTGADAWQLFFVWTIFIAAWVVAADFAPLWLIFLVLVNTTIALFWAQTRPEDVLLLCDILFCIDAGFVVACEFLFRERPAKQKPVWLLDTVSICAFAIITYAVIEGILNRQISDFYLLFSFFLAGSAFTAGLIRGIGTRTAFYPAIIAVCIIAIISTMIAKRIDDAVGATFIVGIFIISAVALSVRLILQLKKMNHGNE